MLLPTSLGFNDRDAIETIILFRVNHEHITPARELLERVVELVSDEYREEVKRLVEQALHHIGGAPSTAIHATLHMAAAVEELEPATSRDITPRLTSSLRLVGRSSEVDPMSPQKATAVSPHAVSQPAASGPIDDPDFLSVKTIATRLSISDEEVLKRIHAGEIPALRLGKRLLVPRKHYQAYVKQLELQADVDTARRRHRPIKDILDTLRKPSRRPS